MVVLGWHIRFALPPKITGFADYDDYRTTLSTFVLMQHPLIVLTFEGLTPAALGCYGSSWNRSPVIDSIAGSGALWDRCLAVADDPDTVFQRMAERLLAGFRPSSEGGTGDWDSIELLTDVQSIADGRCDPYFDRIDVVHDGAEMADETAQTDPIESQLGRLFATAIQRDAAEQPWSVLWLHSGFLTRRWDAPRVGWPMIDQDESSDELDEPVDPQSFDGQDKTPVSSSEPEPPRIFESVVPPCFQLTGDEHPDLVTSWMRTYACQIQMLDLLLEMLISAMQDRGARIVISATSGFRLGQGGWIGHKPKQFRSRDVHVPMIYGGCDPVRYTRLASTDAAAEAIGRMLNGAMPLSPWDKPDLDQSISVDSDRSSSNLTTLDWFFVRDCDSSERLFSKPDDIDDFNDVARIRPDVVSLLESAQKNSAGT